MFDTTAEGRHSPPRPFGEDIIPGIPDDIARPIEQLEDMFLIDRKTLKRITDHFESELEKGLSEKGGDIPMNVTWVLGYPTGNEQGRFLTLDMGGTNLRVCEVVLSTRKGECEVIEYKCKMPPELRTGTAEQLWDFVAECLQTFVHEHHKGGQTSEKLPLAFTFSYPVTQSSIRNGILQRWTKGFNVPGVEGHDVVPQLEAAIEKRKVPVKIVALVNDTTGTLIASAYRDPETKIGSIFSTGCNAAYMEDKKSIPKIKNAKLPDDTLIAINTEYGAFDNERKVLPRTRYDEEIDKDSPRPGQQTYEKMVAGLYLGELLRLVLLELHESKVLFQNQDVSALRQPHVVDTSFFSTAEKDTSDALLEVHQQFKVKFGINPALHELKACRHLVQLLGRRAARLYACGIAAICKKKKIESCRVGVDGSVFENYTMFGERASQALREILDWPDGTPDLITLQKAEDGSAIGAALVAALALDRPDGKVGE